MAGLLGEYECKIDSKGRMRLPSPLLKQLGTEGTPAFVINRGLEKCLMLYPRKVWDQIEENVNQLNKFSKKNRDFIRFLYRGATEVAPDGQERILLSKRLMEFAGITKDVLLISQGDRLEIWDVATYDKLEESKSMEDFSDVAEEVSQGFMNLSSPISKLNEEEAGQELKDDLTTE